jgi:hypothetical protein
MTAPAPTALATAHDGRPSKPKRLFSRKRARRAAADFYVDPPFATELLLDVESFAGKTWDPACGIGNVANALKGRGLDVIATDLHDRGYADCQPGIDFLQPSIFAAAGVDNIVCNPPYGQAEAFIRRGLEVARRKVAMLLQEKFLYSEERYLLFSETPLSRLLFFSSRPSMPPGELLQAGAVKAEGGSINFLWAVWDHAHPRFGGRWAPPTAGWLIKPQGLVRVRNRAAQTQGGKS